MTTTDQRTYSTSEAAAEIAADVAFVERAIGAGLVPSIAPDRLDSAGLRALRALYVESGQALADIAQSALDEGWYDTDIDRLRALGIIDADEGDAAAR